MRIFGQRISKAIGSIVGAAVVMMSFIPVAESAPIIIGSYYSESVRSFCGSPSDYFCQLNFKSIPFGKYLLVSDISCNGETKNAPNIPTIMLRSAGSEDRETNLVPVFTGNQVSGSVTLRYYVANESGLYISEGGSTPLIYAKTFANQGLFSFLDCTISGTLRSAP